MPTEVFEDPTVKCPECSGPYLRNYPGNPIVFQHTDQCPIRAALDGRSAADWESAQGSRGAKVSRPLATAERSLLDAVGLDYADGAVAYIEPDTGRRHLDLNVEAEESTTEPVGVYAYLLVPGPVGPSGPRGADGAPGSPGTDGQDGSDGRDGTDGTDGVDGQDGAPGAPGAASVVPGPEGPRGPSGSAGERGATGERGERGPEGPAGRDLTATPAVTLTPSFGELAIPADSGSAFVTEPTSGMLINAPSGGWSGQRVLLTLDNRASTSARQVRLSNAPGNYTIGSSATMVPGSLKTVPANGLAWVELTRVAGAWFPTLWNTAA